MRGVSQLPDNMPTACSLRRMFGIRDGEGLRRKLSQRDLGTGQDGSRTGPAMHGVRIGRERNRVRLHRDRFGQTSRHSRTGVRRQEAGDCVRCYSWNIPGRVIHPAAVPFPDGGQGPEGISPFPRGEGEIQVGVGKPPLPKCNHHYHESKFPARLGQENPENSWNSWNPIKDQNPALDVSSNLGSVLKIKILNRNSKSKFWI